MATLTCVFAMLALGALVTSFKAGMADNTWPRTPWHLFVIEWENWGLVIEHTHRFVGYVLGVLMIVLYLPMSYYTDRFLYNRRQRQKQGR